MAVTGSAHGETEYEVAKDKKILIENEPSVLYLHAVVKSLDGTKRLGDDLERVGSGFVISQDGYAITAAHVIPKADENSFVEIDGYLASEPSEHLTINYVKGNDYVALLQIKGPPSRNWRPITPGDSEAVKPRDHLVALGFGTGDYNPSSGYLRHKHAQDEQGNNWYWATTAPINHGDSGGPVFDANGKLVAMASEGNGYANQDTLVMSAFLFREYLKAGADRKDQEQAVLAVLPDLPVDVYASFEDDIQRKLELINTRVPVKRELTVFYEPRNAQKGFVKLQIIQYGAADSGAFTEIKGRSVASQPASVRSQGFLVQRSGFIQPIQPIVQDRILRYVYPVSTGDIVAVAAAYSDDLVSGNASSTKRMDWTSVAVQELAARGPIEYDFAIGSEYGSILISSAAEFWKRAPSSTNATMARHIVISSDLGNLPHDFFETFHLVAKTAASMQEFKEEPFKTAFEYLSKASLTEVTWTTDRRAQQVHNVVYVTQQEREK